VTSQAIDYTAWRFWFDALQLIGTGVIGVYVWWANREKVTATKFAELEKKVAARIQTTDHKIVEDKRNADCLRHQTKMGELELNIGRIGSEVRNMPSRQEMAVLSHDINDLTNQLGQLKGRLEGINRVADLINEFLINQGANR